MKVLALVCVLLAASLAQPTPDEQESKDGRIKREAQGRSFLRRLSDGFQRHRNKIDFVSDLFTTIERAVNDKGFGGGGSSRRNNVGGGSGNNSRRTYTPPPQRRRTYTRPSPRTNRRPPQTLNNGTRIIGGRRSGGCPSVQTQIVDGSPVRIFRGCGK